MTDRGPSIAEIKAALGDRIEALVPELLPQGHRETQEWRCGSIAGEPGDSLGVHLSGPKSGIWCDFAGGPDDGGDLIDLIMATRSLTKGAAIAWALEWLGLDERARSDNSSRAKPTPKSSPKSSPKADNDVDQCRRIAHAREIWKAAEPAAGTLAETYLRARGITIPVPPTIRFNGALRHGPTSLLLPAMVAAVQGSDRRVVGIHRTYLRADGIGKAGIATPKMSLGAIAGGAVRLGPAGPKIAVAEGIETSLSIAQSCPGLSVWASLSTSGMRALVLPDQACEVVLCPDGDASGEEAALAAAKRFVGEGRVVRIARPDRGADFNDMILGAAA
jgi:hypothetical protein